MTLERDQQAEARDFSDIATSTAPPAPEHQAGSSHPAFITQVLEHPGDLPNVTIIGRESPGTIHGTSPQNQVRPDEQQPIKTVAPRSMTPDGLFVDFGNLKTDPAQALEPTPAHGLDDGHRQPPSGGGTWFSREASEVSSAALTTLSDFESATAKAASDIVHGKATVGEVAVLAVEAGSLVGLGAAFAMAAGASAPVLCPIVVGGMAVAVGGELLMMAEMKHWL